MAGTAQEAQTLSRQTACLFVETQRSSEMRPVMTGCETTMAVILTVQDPYQVLVVLGEILLPHQHVLQSVATGKFIPQKLVMTHPKTLLDAIQIVTGHFQAGPA